LEDRQGIVVNLERLLQRDRAIVAGGLLGLAAIAWVYTYGLVGGAWPSLMAMPQRHGWTSLDLALTVLMWAVMMIAMMTPSVTPTILLVATVERRRGEARPAARAAMTLAGYFTVWTAASLLAALAQWALHDAALLNGPMGRLAPRIAGIVLIAVGLYQWTPLKAVCLGRCRSPVETIADFWRPGARGAFILGLRHGVYCLGCCWALMAVLFVIGIMNLVWVALLSVLVLAEKMLPRGLWLGRIAGLGLAAWGLVLAIGG
jgi:predicted metal-binding membrane protein